MEILIPLGYLFMVCIIIAILMELRGSASLPQPRDIKHIVWSMDHDPDPVADYGVRMLNYYHLEDTHAEW